MSNKLHICTYFDINYLPRGLALYYSIRKFHENIRFYVLAFDIETLKYLNALEDDHTRVISEKEYNNYFQTSAAKYLDKKQYYFSSTPNICLYLIKTFPEIDILLYLDADVYLFNKLDSLYEEFGDSSIGFTPHRVHPFLNFFVRHYGKFNVGVNLFRNSEEGLACLRDWKDDCDTWYPDKPEYPLKFFSDQIFLDSWPEKFNGVKVIENIGVNLCYWNVANYKIRKKESYFYVNGKPLIIYHFSSLHKLNSTAWNTSSVYGLASIKKDLFEIYRSYIKHIESFGLSNNKWEKMDHKRNIKKKIAHFLLSLFINEIVVVDETE